MKKDKYENEQLEKGQFGKETSKHQKQTMIGRTNLKNDNSEKLNLETKKLETINWKMTHLQKGTI